MHRESRRRATQRTLTGARLATLSVLAGAVATAASLSAVAYVAEVGSAAADESRTAIRLASHAKPHLAPRLPHDEESTRSVQERPIGSIALVDVGPEVASLDDEFERQRALALRREERLLLLLVVEDCKPCTAVEAALSSAELQRSLGHSRLVRLDAGSFVAELSRLGVPVDTFPSFVLLGPDGRATDYVDGSEWEEDSPPSIAPVLKSFVEGTYTKRKAPWRGGLHEDETAI